MIDIILPFFISMFISLLFTPLAKKLAITVGAVDIPKDSRRVHRKPIPYLGGVAIYVSVVLTSLIFIKINKTLISILLGGSLIFISGILDDIRDISPRAKLAFQIGAAIILIIGGIRIDFITNPFNATSKLIFLKGFSIPITIFWLVGITNTLNLIDGVDGLATGIAIIASISFLVVANTLDFTPIMIMSATVAGSCLGFLPYNFNPAKIFMGDAGSLFLGFMLAAMSIEGVMKSVATIAVIVPIIILGVPIFDTIFAIFRRALKGKRISEADKGHLHHRLLGLGFSQKKVALILYGMSAIFGLSAVLIARANNKSAVIFSVIIFILAILLAGKMGLINEEGVDSDEED